MKNTHATIPRLPAFWLYPMVAAQKPISEEEKSWSFKLTRQRSLQYQESRGLVRESLSRLWEIPPLEVPLKADPGKPPRLPEGWGYLSFSHCPGYLLVGWSSLPIGVDIERMNRAFNANNIANRYFNFQEKLGLNNLSKQELRNKVLEIWVVKEAAIKWQQGNLAQDFRQWNWDRKSGIAKHRSKDYAVKIYHAKVKQVRVALAFNQSIRSNFPQICISEE